ncbi:uncharacterized protein LOC133931254 [Phragmites australis]|uniref:uncharacterized protein LOC133931254 n=1 Tax=Phragmites australis TaxID=29695 RepID=UPI002D794418|nr:uncharacterized protein LOC133931254 [Phragmites australis]
MSIIPQGEAAWESGGGSFQYPQLMVKNYKNWVIQVQEMIEDQGVWEAVEPAASAAVDEKKDKKERLHLFQALPEDLLMQVARKKTRKEVWDYLKTRFVTADRVKNAWLLMLKSDFNAMRMQKGESLGQYAGRLNNMSVRYANLGETLDDAALVKKLFDTVPDRFLSVITGIKQFYDLDKMPFEEVVGRLKAFEERAHPRGSGGNSINDSQLLFTQAEWQVQQKKDSGNSSSSNKGKSHIAVDSSNRGRGGRGCSRGHGRGGHGGMSCNAEESGSGGGRCNKSHIKCYNCYKMGHYANECKALKKKEEETHLTHAGDIELALLLVVSEEPAQEQQHQRGTMLLNEEKLKPELRDTTKGGSSFEFWYLDNGASNHMTSDKEKFKNLDNCVTDKVKFGDGSTMQIMGLGSVVFSCKNGDQWLLQEVYYISRLCSNIISLGQLIEVGHKVIMDAEHLRVYDNSPVWLLMKVRRAPNCLYKIELHQATLVCLLTSLEDQVWL